MAKNVHRVHKHQWAKWNKDEQAAFNRFWDCVTPELLPKDMALTQKQFFILRWNACWTLANMLKCWRPV